MILRGARVALGPGRAEVCSIELSANSSKLDLAGYLVLPGLINAHDHLEYNLFPRLGRGAYLDAAAWARDIYRPDAAPVRDHRRVPKRIRLLWGGLKNLVSGVTTVCHHNPYQPGIFDRNFPVRVLKRFGWAHSLAFSPDLARRYRRTPASWPFIVHLAESRDRAGAGEIIRLDELGALSPRTVLVHGVALDRAGLELARSRGASLVWCPSSNLFVLGRTLSARALASGLDIALGSDSALTAAGDLLDELRVARRLRRLPPAALYAMVTEIPARILRLPASRRPDLVVFRDGGTPAEALFGSPPEMVVVNGRIRLTSPALAAQLPDAFRRRLHLLEVEGRPPVLVDVDTARLHRATERYLGSDLRLAGRRILACT